MIVNTCKHSEEGKPVFGRTISWPPRSKVYLSPDLNPGFSPLYSALGRNYILKILYITDDAVRSPVCFRFSRNKFRIFCSL